MQAQKVFKPSDKILVVCDYREREVAEQLRKLGAVVNTMSLDLADFVCSERVCVERKTHKDFIASIIDGRLFEQMRLLKAEYEKPIMIIEGYSNARINPNALKAAIASVLIGYGIPLVTTKNPADTARMIYWIAQKEQFGNSKNVAIKVGKKQKDIKRLQEQIVASLPGVSTVIGKRLLQCFGSIAAIALAEESELQRVKGIGKRLAKKIKKVLNENY